MNIKLEKRRVLLILGMHRSGTSAATRVVNILGADLGNDLVEPGPDNPDGFWEHAEVVRINDALLSDLGRTWYDMREMSPNWQESEAARQAYAEIEALIRENFQSGSLWAIKDPRMCLTAPLWINVFRALDYEVDCLFIVRNPREVVDSLHVRNKWSREPLFLMWVQYLKEAEAASRQTRRALITYDDLLADWRGTMERVAVDLNLSWPVPLVKAAADVGAFLNRGRRHHRAEPVGEAAKIDSEVPELAGELYQACLSISQKGDPWDVISERLLEYTSVASLYAPYVDELLKLRWQAEASVQMAEERLAVLQASHLDLRRHLADVEVASAAAIDEMRSQIAKQSAMLTEKDSAIAKQSVMLTERDSAIAKQSAMLTEKDSAIAKQSAMLTEKDSAIAKQFAMLTEKDSVIAKLSGDVSKRDAHIHAMENSTSWRVTAPLRWARRMLVAKNWRTELARSLKFGYERLPLPTHRRLALKGAIFRMLAPMISGSHSYRAWQAYEAHRRVSNRDGQGQGAVRTLSNGQSDVSLLPGAIDGVSDLASRVLSDLNSAAGGVAGEHVAMDERPVDPLSIDVRAIAFYLPQFHPIPENDAWWGRGFTEWTNVSKAVPQFLGHYQPHLPGELGFYDLRLVDVMRRQVELAKHYGLQGFCFHYYWFGGRRLLERPLEQFVANKDIEFPFCICWANENWSRRWDGMDQDILVGQNHSPEDDIAFITALDPLLRDSRYIRVGGKPLIVLYRPSILPDAKATQQRWREYCRKSGIGEIVLAMVQFDVEDPRIFGFDVAIEFPPHKLARGLDPMNDKLHIVNPDYSGYVVDINAVIERAREHSAVDFDMIRGVFPSWDNEARKPGRGYTFANATPARYREWLDLAVDYARKRPVAGERMVFINAWNEWAEGAHLEPDRRYGYAYLAQTREALMRPERRSFDGQRLIIVSHDAHPHGAQYLALNMARVYRQTFNFEIDVILLGEGHLAQEFRRWATVHDLTGCDPEGQEAERLAAKLYRAGGRHAIANTTVSGLMAKTLKQAGMAVVSLVHEQAGVINNNNLLPHAQAIADHADRIVFPAEQVRREFSTCARLPEGKTVIRPQGLYKLNRYASAAGRDEAREKLRHQLALSPEAKVVLCVGYADHRKGVDIFVESGIRLMQQRDDVHYVWVGHADVRMQPQIEDRVRESGFGGRFHFVGLTSDTDAYYAGADVYALTSREDPFPSVVMESLQVGVPVIGFDGAGGFTELLSQGGGRLVPMADIVALTDAVAELLVHERAGLALGDNGRGLVEANHSFRSYLFDLLDSVGAPLPKVSVIVPNYNYERYIESRINSVFDQQMPFYELIVLDDASTDDSVAVIERLAAERGVHLRIVRNEANSGSVFKQWEKGVELARGDYVWIAEADDLAEPGFLLSVMSAMEDAGVVMAYCESKQIDGNGAVMAENYRDYTKDVSADHWCHSYRQSGRKEIENHLAIKNTVPNVSAVIFRREALKLAIKREKDRLAQFKVAGDWLVYTAVLDQGDVAFIAEGLNLHRRHRASVTIGGDNRPHMAEILRMQRLVRERYRVPEDVARKADAYVATLRGYFGLSESEVARLTAEVAKECTH